MADFLTEQRDALEKRLKELRPLYDEYLNLERVREALDGVRGARRGPGRPRGTTGKRGPGRPPGSSARARSANGRQRRTRRGGRADQALKVVRANPGITVNDLAKRLNVKSPNYLYRVMSQLVSDGAVSKTGKGYTAK